MADSTLTAIRNKVRRITRSPSEANLTTAQLDQYINTFVLYNFPEHIRLTTLRSTLTFYTDPNIDIYQTNTININDPLYNFKNRYISVHPPVFMAGNQSVYLQSREQFFAIYPKVQSIQNTGQTGNGVNTLFSGTLSQIPVLLNEVMFTSKDANGAGIVVRDVPRIDAVTGKFTIIGDLVEPNDTAVSLGTINYVTGVYSFNFPVAPANGEPVTSQTVPYTAGMPQVLLFYDTKFQIRPVPDKVYAIQMEVFLRPTELLSANQSPDLEQWWEYISVGAALKVFEDRVDTESMAQIDPLFKRYEDMVMSNTVMQLSNQRSPTIYSEQAGFWPGNNYWGNFNN